MGGLICDSSELSRARSAVPLDLWVHLVSAPAVITKGACIKLRAGDTEHPPR